MSNYASAVESSKIMKQMLRKAFPATEFSIRMSRGTAYGSVTVSWTDGPTTKRVEEITNRFVGKTFDGMTDSTGYTRNTLPDGRTTGCGYVHTSRDISPSFARRLSAQVAHYFGVEMPAIVEYTSYTGAPAWKLENDSRHIPQLGEYASTMIHRAAQDRTRYAR